MRFDRAKFFDIYRGRVAGGSVAQGEVDYLTQILDRAETDSRVHLLGLAAMIGTARWETRRFTRMREEGSRSYFEQYDGKSGNRKPGDGYKYRGNGFCHTTFYDNHARAQRELMERGIRVDLIGDPDQLWQNADANYEVMVAGWIGGWFTKWKLADVVTETNADYRAARLVINPGELFIADGRWRASAKRRQQCIEAINAIVRWSEGTEAALKAALVDDALPDVATLDAEEYAPRPAPEEVPDVPVETKPGMSAKIVEVASTGTTNIAKVAAAGGIPAAGILTWLQANWLVIAIILVCATAIFLTVYYFKQKEKLLMAQINADPNMHDVDFQKSRRKAKL